MATTEVRTETRDQLPGLAARTLCEAFQLSAAAFPDQPALRSSDGEFEITWRDYAERVERIAAGLAALGVTRGDSVGLMLVNRPEVQLIDAAALHLGATPFSVYNTSAPEQISYLLGNAGNRVMLTESRFLPQLERADAPALEHLVVIDGDGADAPNLVQVEDARDPGFDVEAAWRAVSPDDLATLIYTSGTTGPPKGVELTHSSLMFTVRAAHEMYGLRRCGLVSYLPHAHLIDRYITNYIQAATGSCVTTVADPTKVVEALPGCRPGMFVGVPRFWEKLRSALIAGFGRESPERREAIERGLDLGLRKVSDEQAGREPSTDVVDGWSEADAAIFAPLRERLGLDRLYWPISGSAPIPVAVLEFFAAIGVPICEGWGMSETAALGTLNEPSSIRIGTVGRPIAGTELILAEDNEIVTRGPHLMRGYRNDPESTAGAIDGDGWLHTGDIGSIDADGYVKIVDRKKELIINAGGKNMSPANIEAKLKSSSSLIGLACCVGDGRPYNVALLVLDPDGAAAYAAEHGLADGSAAAMVEHESVRAEVAAGVQNANAQLSRVEQIKRYALLPVEWQPDGEELTPTMKLKRRGIEAKYAGVIDDLYSRPR